MTGLTLTLTATVIAGMSMLYFLFIPNLSWNWKAAHVQFAARENNGSFFLGLITLLSTAAIFFSVDALLFTHGILMHSPYPRLFTWGALLCVVLYNLSRRR